jgi:hypothetical protein
MRSLPFEWRYPATLPGAGYRLSLAERGGKAQERSRARYVRNIIAPLAHNHILRGDIDEPARKA